MTPPIIPHRHMEPPINREQAKADYEIAEARDAGAGNPCIGPGDGLMSVALARLTGIEPTSLDIFQPPPEGVHLVAQGARARVFRVSRGTISWLSII